VVCSLTPKDAVREMAEGRFSAAVLDYYMPDANGVELMGRLRGVDPNLPVIILTAAQDIKLAVSAIKEGAYTYLVKPVDPDELYANLDGALRTHALSEENRRLKSELANRYRFDSIIGSSAKMMGVYELTHKASRVRSTALILGETGVGKELIAKAIHYNSDRAEKPFVRVNCAAMPESMLEAELFGIDKNVATGVDARLGKFEAADGGTLFLDEIGDMSLTTQAKVLRAMQEREIERVGSNESRKVDIRILAATHRDLPTMIEEGAFRPDLFYRLNVLVVTIPPLRERKEDIPDLATHFIEKVRKANNLPLRRLSVSAMEALTAYDWPGNVRELENRVERATVVADDEIVDVVDLPRSASRSGGESPFFAMPDEPVGDLEEAVGEFEKGIILAALERNGFRQNKAAAELGVTERSMWYKIKKYGIDPKGIRDADSGETA
jgi:DNA-binding NtrC family response regulator